MTFSGLASLVFAYLLGSISVGVLASRSLGSDVRGKDFSGTSGMLRQYGWKVGLSVFVADVLKGLLAAWLVHRIAPEVFWLAPLAVVVGHCWPIFFGFKGGQGLAPMIGAWGYSSPLVTLAVFVLALAIIPIHNKYKWERGVKLKSTPFAAICVFLLLIVFTAVRGPIIQLWGLLLVLAAMLLRGLQVLMAKRLS